MDDLTVREYAVDFAIRHKDFKDYRGEESPSCLNELLGVVIGMAALLGTPVESIGVAIPISFEVIGLMGRSVDALRAEVREALDNA